MRVGLTILTHQGQSVWENGIGQNIFFLATLLDSLEFVEKVYLINCGDQAQLAPEAHDYAERFPLVNLQEAGDLLDIAIEVGGGLDLEWGARFRARGGRICFHNCGQPYAALIEPGVFNTAGFFSAAERCDEIWILPKDRMFRPMLRALHRCPVMEVPYLWADEFLQRSANAFAATGQGQYGYKDGALTESRPINVAMFEPNISPLKTALIPLLACEALESDDPQLLGSVHFLNSAHFWDHTTLVFMRNNLEIGKSGKIKSYAREFFAPFIAKNVDVVISHQLNWEQNYLYMDVLYGGYPLVHNSSWFNDVGYYYADCDARQAAEQVRLARREHDANLATYRRNVQAMIRKLDPLAFVNRDAYARRLVALAEGYGLAGRIR